MQLPNIFMHSALKSQNLNSLVLFNLISVHDRKKKITAKNIMCTLNSGNVLIHLSTISFHNPKRALKKIRDKNLMSLLLSFLRGSGAISASTYLRTFTN